MSRTRCKSCNAEIVYALTINGVPAPFDAKPDPDGAFRLLGYPQVEAIYVKKDDRPKFPDALHINHFGTCPDRDRWRRKGAGRAV